MMYRLAPATRRDLTPDERRKPLTEEELQLLQEEKEAIGRWEGEGGAATDRFGVVEDLARRKEDLARANALRQEAKATWPGWTSSRLGKLTPPPRVGSPQAEFRDFTDADIRSHGFYLITVPAWQYSQLLRASHATASRVARSRLQYGDSELHFLDSIDTPALD